MSRRTRAARQAPPAPASCGAKGTGRHEETGAMTTQTSPASEPSAFSVDTERRGVLLDEEVAPLAYAIWLAQGRPEGTDREDWFGAERRLREERGGMPALTPAVAAEQAREADEGRQARGAGPSNRDRMVAIGRGNQQAGRQGS